ncbi:hypothetical protein F3Y22_tig00111584pilonHSYRG00094 [Hibiscus syriacus]|uniref:Late embryogenesis abundant protein LEA-2 subgroup domain-containing protein n=1 Tax=Hibiscus syriacus TaxID=106335 RepID=A0A6A2XM28_HIBSY|nr:uncharacterized protein LOC120165568 [Hibiscus syriacus]KAE8676542.1 hypothetical protein F3Y22_tig00111584pilonHSYRG00094 [Hibiscus syriacus]
MMQPDLHAPYPGYAQPNPYAHAPPAHYNYYNQGYVAVPPRERRRSEVPSALASVIVCLFFMIAVLVIIDIVYVLFLGPRYPGFYVDSMSVSNFNTETNPLVAKWDTKITVENPNGRYKLNLDHMAALMFYDDDDEENDHDHDLGSTEMKPVEVATENKTNIQLVISTGEHGQRWVPSWIVRKMDEDRRKGSVKFELIFTVKMTWESVGGSLPGRD